MISALLRLVFSPLDEVWWSDPALEDEPQGRPRQVEEMAEDKARRGGLVGLGAIGDNNSLVWSGAAKPCYTTHPGWELFRGGVKEKKQMTTGKKT